jgi:hypothetical protein
MDLQYITDLKSCITLAPDFAVTKLKPGILRPICALKFQTVHCLRLLLLKAGPKLWFEAMTNCALKTDEINKTFVEHLID